MNMINENELVQSLNNVSIEVIVGKLPEWYDEDFGHDYIFEDAIRDSINSVFNEPDEIKVSYAYSGEHYIRVWNEAGDLRYSGKVIDGFMDEIFSKVAEELE